MTELPGVAWGRVTRHGDSRGSFREVWRRSRFDARMPSANGIAGSGFVQANVSISAAGVLRGLHYHNHQLDYWVLLSGRAFVALVDLRPVSMGAARPAVETRELGADETVTIPAGIAHGFLALEPLELLYLVTNEYDGADELGLAWDDPVAAVPWPRLDLTPDGRPILSERDRRNPSLQQLTPALRGAG